MTDKDLQRFWAKVDKSGECWVWTSWTYRGYGYFYFHGKNTRAHRLSYLATGASIPDGLVIDHICRNRACVRPSHLRVVTNRENVLCGDGLTAQNAKRTHCPQGHEYSKENTMLRKSKPKGRVCKTCYRAYRKQYDARRRPSSGLPKPFCARGHEKTPENVLSSRERARDGISIRIRERCRSCQKTYEKNRNARLEPRP